MIRVWLKRSRRNSRNAWEHVADPAAWFGTEIGFLGLLYSTQRLLRYAATDDEGDADAYAYAPYVDVDAHAGWSLFCLQLSAYIFHNVSLNFKDNITSDLSNLLPFMSAFSGCMAGKPYVHNPDTQR